MTTFPDMLLKMEDILNMEERVVYCWTLIGTNSGSGGTGKRVRFSGYEVWLIGSDRLVAESLGHFDNASYQYQLVHGIED